MDFFSNLKIRNKLIIGFAVVIVSCCFVGFFGLKGMSEIKARMDDMHNNLIPSITSVSDIDHHAQQHRRYLLRYLPEADVKQRKEFEDKISREERQIQEELERFQKFPLQPDERRLISEVIQACQVYFDATAKLIKKANAGASYDLLDTENERIFTIFSNLEDLLKKLSQFNSEEADVHFEQSTQSFSQLLTWMSALIIISVILAVAITLLIIRSIADPLSLVLDSIRSLQEGSKKKARLVEAIAGGDLDQETMVTEPLIVDLDQVNRDEAGMLLKAIVGMSEVQYVLDQAFAEMTSSLRHNRDQEALRDWLKNGLNMLDTILRGDKSTAEMTNETLAFLTEYLGAGVGALYVFDEKEALLHISASYAVTRQKHQIERIAIGEGLAGQAALERKMICVSAAPPEYLQISSGLGESSPAHIVVVPFLKNEELVGVLELGSFKEFSSNELEFLSLSMEGIAIALSVLKSRKLVDELLEQTQGQAEELRVQQEELQQTNEELEERAQMLEQQREQIRTKNRALEEAGGELQRKADELERVSTYKSEFLANMSHELRTPLNSLMILSSLLKDNREGNLTDKQVEFAATINSAGRDLLNLINDILDLSKIESGHLEFHYEELVITEICEQLGSIFRPIAGNKGVEFDISVQESVPVTITVDGQRHQQILKNLLSNACKFTTQGSVALRIYVPDPGENLLKTPAVAFAVTDTGIGIPADKQSIIFNAFQQADGSTSRTYGGTGLGLSISRQLARTMGGEISLVSETGKGSTFTLYLPVSRGAQVRQPTHAIPSTHDGLLNQASQKTVPTETPRSKSLDTLPPAPIPDNRETIQKGDKSILIIEDDLKFAAILSDMVRGRGFSVLVASDGESGITLADRYQPSAVILDVMLPHIDGWGVMRSLKDNSLTRHIPVHFITCMEERQKAMNMGAIGFVTKPVSSDQLDEVFSILESAIVKTMKMLLIVEDDQNQANALVALLEDRNVTIKVADTGDKAIELLSHEQFDCIVLDLGLADMGAFELLEELKKLDPGRRIPVIIHTGRDLTHDDEKRLHQYAESIIIKGAKSPERLLNEVTLFLHLVETSLDPGKQRMIRTALDKEAMLEGKKILIVDDDMRNIFSLSSALAEKNIVIFEAENGREALKQLEDCPEIDLVLMDIMMPEMDGYEAMRLIRKDSRFASLPIIALTAKAMKGDREECLKAGASDYIPKPVDMEKLFSLLRVWLYTPAASSSMDMG